MTLADFLANYEFQFTGVAPGNVQYHAITRVIRRADNRTLGTVNTTLDILETSEWIGDSNAPNSLIGWDWPAVIDQTKRAHLDYFAQRIPIEEFYPMNSETNIDFLVVR